MLLRTLRQVTWSSEEDEGSDGVRIGDLFAGEEEARKLSLQVYEILPGGHTPYHACVWEHQVYFLGGSGRVRSPGGDESVGPGDAVIIPAGEPHQFLAGEEPLSFLCATPLMVEGKPGGKVERASGSGGGAPGGRIGI